MTPKATAIGLNVMHANGEKIGSAKTHFAAKMAAELLNRSWAANEKRKYTDSARLMAKAGNVEGFEWAEGWE